MMKHSLWTILMVMAWGATGVAFANDCDPAFQGVEVYLCKHGKVEHKVGLKTDTRTECVELKKLQVNACEVEPVTTAQATQQIYFLGASAQKDKFSSYEFQCDQMGGSGRGGMSSSGFEGYMHPDYTIAKFPGESNNDRAGRFFDDLAKQGKAFLGGVLLTNPAGKYMKKFDKQTCQFFDAKTNKVALRFNATVDYADEQDKKAASGGGDAGKGLKKLFGF